MSYHHRTTCRLCDSLNLELAVPMKPCPIVDNYTKEPPSNPPRYPTDLYLCRGCGHAQLLDVVNPHILYGHYIYTSATSPGFVSYFQDYAITMNRRFGVGEGSSVLDIGSNDGTLLKQFKRLGARVTGIDPAKALAYKATNEGVLTFPEYFTSAWVKERGEKYHLVTCNNAFAHSDNLPDMADGVREALMPGGVAVFEVAYLRDAIDLNIFDSLYHEHLDHHSVKPLRRFLAKHGLRLFDVERTQSKGGTLRCFAHRVGDLPLDGVVHVSQLEAEEAAVKLHEPETFKDWTERIATAKLNLHMHVDQELYEFVNFAGYGAASNSTVLMNEFDLAHLIHFIADDNTNRHGLYSPLGPRVVPPSELLARKPACCIILAWRYADQIIAKNRAYVEQGGTFIVPLPKLRTYGPAELEAGHCNA